MPEEKSIGTKALVLEGQIHLLLESKKYAASPPMRPDISLSGFNGTMCAAMHGE